MITSEFNLWSLHQRLMTLYFLFPSRWPRAARCEPPDPWYRDRRRRDDQTHRKEHRRTHQEVTDLLHSRRQPANSYNPSFWRCVHVVLVKSFKFLDDVIHHGILYEALEDYILEHYKILLTVFITPYIQLDNVYCCWVKALWFLKMGGGHSHD